MDISFSSTVFTFCCYWNVFGKLVLRRVILPRYKNSLHTISIGLWQKEGKLLVIAPDDTCGVTTLKHRDDDIMKLYGKGYKDAERIIPFLGL